MAEIIGFYYPAPKQAKSAPAVEELPAVTAASVLKQVSEHAAGISEVMILFHNSNGSHGFLSNLEDLGDAVLFLERFKLRLLNVAPPNSPNGVA